MINFPRGSGRGAPHPYCRAFRGVHQQSLHRYVVTYEAMVNAKRITPELIRQMYLGNLAGNTGYT
jgi:hypothetical protein